MVKGIVNAFDHMEFCLVLHLTNTSVDAKRAVKLQPILLPGILVFCYQLLHWVASTCYLQKNGYLTLIVECGGRGWGEICI